MKTWVHSLVMICISYILVKASRYFHRLWIMASRTVDFQWLSSSLFFPYNLMCLFTFYLRVLTVWLLSVLSSLFHWQVANLEDKIKCDYDSIEYFFGQYTGTVIPVFHFTLFLAFLLFSLQSIHLIYNQYN